MAVAMVSPDGYRVEVVRLQRVLSRPPKPMLRLTFLGYFRGDYPSPAELRKVIDLATLDEE